MKSSICAVDGFLALGKHIGIKKKKKDFAVIYSDVKCNAAGAFTQNKVKGAPLYLTMEHLKNGKAQAIIVNSGIANVSTGKKGGKDAKLTAELAAIELGIDESDVLVASTGVIGKEMPMDIMKNGIVGVRGELSTNDKDAAKAILTTDLVEKEVIVKGDNFIIGGIAKGSGMIHPNMATMLAFLTTDADINSVKLKSMLKKAVDKSFNMTSVDMQTSTSDMALIMANGKAGKVNEHSFQKALDKACITLAKKIAKDGEGATKLIEATVKGAKSEDDAKSAAKSIITSDLFKCAVYGNDPNWGRVTCSLGNSGAEFLEENIEIKIGSEIIYKNGHEHDFDKEKVINMMKKDEVEVMVNLNNGKHEATAYGCDLTEGYVKINAHYHT